MTFFTTLLLGIIYPLVVTGLAQLLFHDKANGQLIVRNGEVVGSRIIGQAFTGPRLSALASVGGRQRIRRRQLWRHQLRSHEPHVDRPRERRCRAPASGESWTASSHRSGNYLRVRLGSRYHSSSSGIPGSAACSPTRPEQGPTAPSHSPVHATAPARISGRAASQCAGGQSRARPTEADFGAIVQNPLAVACALTCCCLD